jgi:hypothetical protein
MKVEGFSDVGRVKNPSSRRTTSSFTRSRTMRGNGIKGKTTQGKKSPNNSKARGSNPKEILSRRGTPFKASQPKGDVSGKPKGPCFNCNEMGPYSKDCPKVKSGNGGSKVIALNANLAQAKCN